MADGNNTLSAAPAVIRNTTGAQQQDEWIHRGELDRYIRSTIAAMMEQQDQRILQLFARAMEDWTYSDKYKMHLAKMFARYLEENPPECGGTCSTSPATSLYECTYDTRLSYQRIVNLYRQKSQDFEIDQQVAPGETKSFNIPAYPLGRVIEYLQFRPRMDTDGNPDDLRVTIRGEDGVIWAQFSGGKHNQEACCLLEVFCDDCIGWGEGWTIEIHHRGNVGDPVMLDAVLDFEYLFPGHRPGHPRYKGCGWQFPCGSKKPIFPSYPNMNPPV